MNSMKHIALLSALASAAYAQSAIPSGLSESCTTFLTNLNSNSTLAACTAPLISATSAFGPGGSPSAASSAAVSSALGSLCAASSGACSDALVRSTLTDFYAQCTPELTSSQNADVVKLYDVLYSMIPLKTAVCAKDDTGAYCVTQLDALVSGSGASSASASSAPASTGTLPGGLPLENVQKYLWVAGSSPSPNATTITASNVLFLFLSPSTPNAQLCKTCTRNVMTAYINFESSIQYAPGLSASLLLSGQTPLYNAIQSKCGSTFLSGAVAAAGSLSNGIASGALANAVPAQFAMGSAALGALGFVAAALF